MAYSPCMLDPPSGEFISSLGQVPAFTFTSESGDIHPILTILKMLVSISSMEMGEYDSYMFTILQSSMCRLNKGFSSHKLRMSKEVRVLFAWDPRHTWLLSGGNALGGAKFVVSKPFGGDRFRHGQPPFPKI